MEEFRNEIKSELAAELDAQIKQQFAGVEGDLNYCKEKLQSAEDTAVEVQQLHSTINNLHARLSKQESYAVAANLRIVGIPQEDNENLVTIFGKISETINITAPAVVAAYRMKHKQNKKRNKQRLASDTSIIIKLRSEDEKINFLKSIITFKKNSNLTNLNLSHAGFNSQAPIFINECLSKNNYNILSNAIAYKKQKRLRSVFTLRGVVHVKVNEQDEPFRVETTQKLEVLIGNLAGGDD